MSATYCQIIFGDERFVNITKPRQSAIAAVEEILKSEETAYPNQDIEVGQVFKEYWNSVLNYLKSKL